MAEYPGYRILKLLPRGDGKQVEISCRILSGGVEPGTPVRLYPGGGELRIRSVEKNGTDALVRVRGVSRNALVPGAVILPADLPIREEKQGLFYHDGGRIPDEKEAFRGGICPDFNRERLIGRAAVARDGSFLSVRFPSPYPMVPGMECSILNPDGSPRRLTLLWPGRPDRREMRKLEADAPRRPDPHPGHREVFGRLLHTAGYARMTPDLLDAKWEGAERHGGWLVSGDLVPGMEKKILRLSGKPGGLPEKGLKVEGYPAPLVQAVAGTMVRDGKLVDRKGWYFPPGDPPLSPFHRSWLERVRAAGEEGLRISSVKVPADREALEALGRSGLISGGAEIWMDPETLEGLAGRMVEGLAAGDHLTMADARERLPGSRVRTLEVLAWLDSRGRTVRLSGDEGRRVE